jgi:NTE family protein
MGCATALLLLLGCASPIENAPLNKPITQQGRELLLAPRGIVGSNVVALSLSGGGLRASAFAFGVLQALAEPNNGQQADLFDDLTFISSVSGGSLTAAYFALHGRAAFGSFRARVLERNLERDLRQSLWSPVNLGRLLAGGLNDRSNLAATLDADIFGGATFTDLLKNGKPDVWINATDLFNRTPFPFIPPLFDGLCSDLATLRVSEAVAASMAVPLAFAPVVMKTYPENCLTPLPMWTRAASGDGASVAASTLASTARAVQRYRDGTRMRYVKLVDGGLTDNQGLASILIARAVAGDAHSPLSEADAVRLSRMLFLIVDAGRPPSGDWALRPDGPDGVDLAIASADAAVDSATRLSAEAFRVMFEQWREGIVRFRCGLPPEQARRHLQPGQPWDCNDVRFYLDVVGFENLPAEQAQRMRDMPTRLALTAEQINTAVAAGRAAALASPALARYRVERIHSAVGAQP